MNLFDDVLIDQKSFSFKDLIGQVDDSSWTPTDVSGAGLVLVINDATWVRVGRLGIATAVITYPVTVNGANSQIGGFPFSCRNIDSGRLGYVGYSNLGTGVYFMMDKNANTGMFFKLDGTSYTNANLSGKAFFIQVIAFT
jgi:hypothetical protein